MKNKPVIKIKLELTDKVLYSTSAILFYYLIYFSFYAYSAAPNKVPYKFDSQGNAINTGASEIFILFPVIAIFVNSLIIYFSRVPHLGNYIIKITEENAYVQYQLASRFLIWISIWISGIFILILNEIFSYSVYGKKSEFTYVYLILGSFFIIFISYLVISYLRNKKEILTNNQFNDK